MFSSTLWLLLVHNKERIVICRYKTNIVTLPTYIIFHKNIFMQWKLIVSILQTNSFVKDFYARFSFDPSN